jgi:hypothetical protein
MVPGKYARVMHCIGDKCLDDFQLSTSLIASQKKKWERGQETSEKNLFIIA